MSHKDYENQYTPLDAQGEPIVEACAIGEVSDITDYGDIWEAELMGQSYLPALISPAYTPAYKYPHIPAAPVAPAKPLTAENFKRIHDEGGAFTKIIAAAGLRQQFCWDAGITITKVNTDPANDLQFESKFSALAKKKIETLMKMYPSQEWLGYMIGNIDRVERIVMIDDLVIPQQRANSVTVADVEYSWDEGHNIVGVIHSHHNMGAFFSGTDDNYINQNHDVSIVVAHNSILGQIRVLVGDGVYYVNNNMKFDAESTDGIVFDVEEFEKAVKEKINNYSRFNMFPNYGRYSDPYGTYGDIYGDPNWQADLARGYLQGYYQRQSQETIQKGQGSFVRQRGEWETGLPHKETPRAGFYGEMNVPEELRQNPYFRTEYMFLGLFAVRKRLKSYGYTDADIDEFVSKGCSRVELYECDRLATHYRFGDKDAKDKESDMDISAGAWCMD